jgi:hypothetical protein
VCRPSAVFEHLFYSSRVGGSERDKREAYVPRPVWVDQSGMWSWKIRSPSVGILLEWRRSPDRRGRPSWQGLVVWAHGGGEVAWSTGMRWMELECIRPMTVADWKDETRAARWSG